MMQKPLRIESVKALSVFCSLSGLAQHCKSFASQFDLNQSLTTCETFAYSACSIDAPMPFLARKTQCSTAITKWLPLIKRPLVTKSMSSRKFKQIAFTLIESIFHDFHRSCFMSTACAIDATSPLLSCCRRPE